MMENAIVASLSRTSSENQIISHAFQISNELWAAIL